MKRLFHSFALDSSATVLAIPPVLLLFLSTLGQVWHFFYCQMQFEFDKSKKKSWWVFVGGGQ